MEFLYFGKVPFAFGLVAVMQGLVGVGSEGWSFGVWDIGQLGERKLQ